MIAAAKVLLSDEKCKFSAIFFTINRNFRKITHVSATKTIIFLCIILVYSYLWLTPKLLSLDNTKKNNLFLCIVLAYSYLCIRYYQTTCNTN